MIYLVKKNKIFLISFILVLLAGSVPVILFSKADVHLFLNGFHSPYADTFFRYITYLGSGIIAIILTIALLFIKVRYALILLTSYLTSGLVVQLLKHLLFPGCDRPVEFFKGITDLYLVMGIEYHSHFSFPSGHAATAFAIFGMLAFLSGKQWVKMLALFGGWFVSYSRVYLSQHFLGDILAGSFLGILAIMIFYWYFHSIKRIWMDKPLHFNIRLRKK